MNKLKWLYSWSSSWTGTVVIVLAIIFFVAQAFVIPSGSMKNTMLIGDMLFVKKFSYGVPTPTIPWIEQQVLPDFDGDGHLIDGKRPQRGDIVVFRYPHNPKIHYVKRCVATSGDILFLKDKKLYLHPQEGNSYVEENYKENKTIKIDDKMFVVSPYESKFKGINHDSSITAQNSPHTELFETSIIQVPDDNFFMMGDNRDHSNDSRFWGTVPYKYIVGKPWFVYFSWDENKKIRWSRIFNTVNTLQNNVSTNTKDKEGIY
ncbi:MAG: signal peptidase I [Epsilonproteobacteria bacterium]|nr:MAG: signal peptidase I [Campylobacterota bacterium]